MRRKWILFCLLGGVAACGATSSAKPCTSCPSVAGQYAETTQATTTDGGACASLFTAGFGDTVSVVQPDGGSALKITGSLAGSFSGTLNTDNSVTLTNSASDSDGFAQGLGGSFTLSGGAATAFSGTYYVYASSTGSKCTEVAQTNWTPTTN